MTDHNAAVVGRCRVRKLTAGLAVMGLFVLAWLPREHRHVTRTDDGRHSDVIHRHFEPHHPAGTHTSVSHEDHDTQWLDSPFTGPTLVSHVSPVNHLLYEDPPIPQPPQATRWAAASIHVSVHDPPWASSHGPRAPPLLSV
ncbi:MAG: hypothetical protein GEV06_22620 [Luteitalea sp.]|nr:hypothetical protein [Luteitalea sp.]